MADKVRIYEIARELGVESREVIREAAELGIEVKSHSSTIDEEEAGLIAESFREQENKESGESSEPEVSEKELPSEQPEEAPAEPKEATSGEREPGKSGPAPAAPRSVIKVDTGMTVGALADKLGLDVETLIANYREFDIIVSENQKIDDENTRMVLEHMGYEAEVTAVFSEPEARRLNIQPRAPVVTVMGHVDHGKTQLLDTIRQTNIISGERGGITQHIGAYRVSVEGKGDIVFIDTPGHEAFTAMRARGAGITDMVVLVVAADDGVMPQTVEAINHANAAGVPIIVAVNKIDLPEADPKRVRTQLSTHNVLTEEWGGDILSVDISARENIKVDDLLDMILLQAEMMELSAPVEGPARGVVVESELDRRTGPTATVIITEGTLSTGDCFICGVAPGRVRAMSDHSGKRIDKAGPATPVSILGFEELPDAGDIFSVVSDRSEARSLAEERALKVKSETGGGPEKITLEDLRKQLLGEEQKELRIILKSDVAGSLEAIKDSLTKMKTEEVSINIIHSGVGGVTKKDIMLASASDAVIICFNISIPGSAKKEAQREGVQVRTYRVIYEIIDDIKKALEGMLEPEEVEEVLGRAEIKKIYNISGVGTIAGCAVINGTVKRNGRARVIRDSRIVYDGKLAALRRFKDDVSEVASGYECGINVENFNDVKEGDIIESYDILERKRTLSEAR